MLSSFSASNPMLLPLFQHHPIPDRHHNIVAKICEVDGCETLAHPQNMETTLLQLSLLLLKQQYMYHITENH